MRGLVLLSTSICLCLQPFASRGEEPRKIDFQKDIQPILKMRCYSCHGHEEQESGLRLDTKRRAMDGGDGGKVIIPGKAKQSRIVQMVSGLDKETGIMPPEGEGAPLTEQQVAKLTLWIDQGATWPDSADVATTQSKHWSFQPIIRPKVPMVANQKWVRNPIDAFVLRRLEKEQIIPSTEADRATLVRRVHLDLIGLPPTPKEVNDFLVDERPDAYELLIEGVLKSKHFGERWARHWLDLARYADSDGYEKDRPRPHAWRYREWVINALNNDMPFDQFTIEQIAGDMLGDATVEQRVASGFHRNTLHNTEGGTDQEEDRVKKTVDRTNTMATIWLGLSLGCAQCHSHKYDPITQREYYSMYAFFNNINETDIDAPLPSELDKYNQEKAAFDVFQAKLMEAVAHYEQTKLATAQASWETTALSQKPVWQMPEIVSLRSVKGATLEKQADLSVLATGKNEQSDVYTVELTTDLTNITAIRLEVLPDNSLAKAGPGRASNGNFVLTTFRATAFPAAGGGAQTVKFATAKADFSQKDWEVAKAINDAPNDGWAVSPQFGKRHVAVFQTEEPVGFDGGTKLAIVLEQTYEENPHNIGRFRLSLTNKTSEIHFDGIPVSVAKALAVESASRTKTQNDEIAKYYRTVDPELAKLQREVEEHAKKAPGKSGTKAQSVAEGNLRQANIHIRGNFLNKGDAVAAKTLAILPPLKSENSQSNRLELGHWLVSEDNPLTARVTVNRIWQRYFDRGLVATVDDFGSQGEKPSHPELLDWLAGELRVNSWKLKHIHKLIVSSATYRQRSASRSDLAVRDPENILLARQTRSRVEAEVVRDLALAASGLLDRKIGGPSVRPPQPAEYSKLTYAGSAKWAVSGGGDRYRRGLYTFFQRTSPYPMLVTFDAPDSNECTATRSTSNTPLQALTLWNDTVFWECAQHLGRRIVRESPKAADLEATNRKRAIYAFQLCLARRPNSDELEAVMELHAEQTKLCQEDNERTKMLVGPTTMPEEANLTELAGWITVGRVLINLDEFITRE